MDFFTESIVTRKKTRKDNFYIGCIVALALLVLYIGLYFVRELGSFFLLFVVAVGYGAYYWIRRFNIEFEYSFTNGELDIDRIIARRGRRRLITVNTKQFDFFAPLSDPQAKNVSDMSIQQTIHAEGNRESERVYVAVLMHKGIKTCLYIEPSEKVVEGIERFIPRKTINKG